MSDESLRRRMLDAATGPPDPERERAMEAELADHPELLDEYRTLRELWSELGELPDPVAPEGARERAMEAVVGAMGEEVRGRRSTSRRALLRVAAGLLLFVAGAAVGSWTGVPMGPATPDEPGGTPAARAPTSPEASEASVWALLIRGGEAPGGEEESGAGAMAEWARDLAGRGRLVDARRLLESEAAWVGGSLPEVRPEPPVGGYYLVRAADRAEALALARESPHLAWGGVVEVLPVAVTP